MPRKDGTPSLKGGGRPPKPKKGKSKGCSTTKTHRYKCAKTLVCNLILMDTDTRDIISRLVDEFNYSKESAEQVVYRTKREIDQQMIEAMKKTAERNYKRLEAIINESDDNDTLKETMQAIDLQNKMSQVYKDKVELDANMEFKVNIQALK